MYKNEFDFDGEQVAPNASASVKCNPGNTVNQVSIETDATLGNVTFFVTARRLETAEPAYALDGVTQVVIDLSTGRRTVVIPAAAREVSTTALGMDGTGYKLLSSGGDE
jgi:hypothetical protein